MFGYVRHCNAKRLMRCTNLLQLSIAVREHPLQKRNMIALAQKFMLNQKQCADVLGISLSAYTKARPKTPLSIHSSEKVLRLAELFDIGSKTFDGDMRSFINWLNTNIPTLGGVVPTNILFSSYGIELIKEQLLRIEYSIPV